MQYVRHTWRSIKLASAVGLVSAPTYYLYRHDWDVRNTGLVRFGRAAVCCGRVVWDYYRLPADADMGPVHWKSASRLLDMCRANGGVFIKVGQHIGALEYLLPLEYVRTMKVLHTDAPQSDLNAILGLVEQELGVASWTELFSEFEPKPIGAASLAQVHRAKLLDGTTVAVKVQHPRVKLHSEVDIIAMHWLVHLVKWIFPRFQFMWLAEEIKRNLPVELDFVSEGNNCERVKRLLADFSFFHVPKIYWQLSTCRVLTMEYCEGSKVDDRQAIIAQGLDVRDVLRKLNRLYSEMIYVHGFVHCDPHPGNVLVSPRHKGSTDAQLILLDHGLYQPLTDEFRVNYCQFWLAVLSRDEEKMRHWAAKMNCEQLHRLFACVVTARSWESIEGGVDKINVTDVEKQHLQANAKRYFEKLTDLLNLVPRQMLLIFKTNDLIHSIEHALDSRQNLLSSFVSMARCCRTAVYRDELRQSAVERWSFWRNCTSWLCYHWEMAKLAFLDGLSRLLPTSTVLAVVA